MLFSTASPDHPPIDIKNLSWVRDALIYWGYYHLVRQHYGFQRLYERKMGGVSERESWWKP